jgi:hypothetical protein
MLVDGGVCSRHSGLLDEEHLGVNSIFAFGVGESSVSNPLFLGVLHDVVTNLCLSNGADGLGFVNSLTDGSSTDGSVDFLVKSFESLFAECDFPFGELFLEFLLVIFLQFIVVFLDVTSENVFSVFLGVEDGLCLFQLLGSTSSVCDDFSL